MRQVLSFEIHHWVPQDLGRGYLYTKEDRRLKVAEGLLKEYIYFLNNYASALPPIPWSFKKEDKWWANGEVLIDLIDQFRSLPMNLDINIYKESCTTLQDSNIVYKHMVNIILIYKNEALCSNQNIE